MTSFLGVPVKSQSGVFGNLYLTEKIGAAEFDDEDEAIAVLLASQAAVAVENAGLLGQIRTMQRQRDLFFAMMNHELRNALTGVYGWAERLVRGKSPEATARAARSEEHTSELQSQSNLVCRLLLEKKKKTNTKPHDPIQNKAPD